VGNRVVTTLERYSDGSLPDLTGSDEDVLRRLGRATWWTVPGRDRTRCRVVVSLLHGNEPSGFRAIRAWNIAGVAPAVDVAFCLCSVETALGPPLWAHRALPGAKDANRCFTPPFHGPEGERARAILDAIERCRPEALVDLHNNTGHSPAYGVGCVADRSCLGVTALFANRFMHSDLRMGTLAEVTARLTPSVVIECGRAGDPIADATALAGLERFLALDDLSDVEPAASAVEVLHRPLRVLLHESASLAFGAAAVAGATLTIRDDVDRHNFLTMPAGALIGWTAQDARWPFRAIDASGADVSEALFVCVDGEVRLRRSIVPVMMTTAPAIAKSDCLFYAMERHDGGVGRT
jgi:hypothetical protein